MSEKYEPLSDEELSKVKPFTTEDCDDGEQHLVYSLTNGKRLLSTISARDAELKEFREAAEEFNGAISDARALADDDGVRDDVKAAAVRFVRAMGV